MLRSKKPITPLARKLERARHPRTKVAVWARVRRGVERQVVQAEAHAAHRRAERELVHQLRTIAN